MSIFASWQHEKQIQSHHEAIDGNEDKKLKSRKQP